MLERERSFWSWGYADKIPSDEVRESMKAMVEMRLGFAPGRVQPLPRFADVRLHPPRFSLPTDLEALASSDVRDRAMHAMGKNFSDIYRAFHLDFSSAPDWVLWPQSDADICRVLQVAEEENFAVVPFGGGTTVVGGVECKPAERRGVLALSMRKMNRVLDVDVLSRSAVIEAGATGPEIERALSPHGLSIRHFPQSFEFSTLGGWIATRAGGHFATAYTHIDDLVQCIELVTPRGGWSTRRLPASGAGPAPDRMILGSEGCFGVITRASVRLFARPQFRRQASVRFHEFSKAVEAVRAIAQASLFPTNCRLLDATEALLNGVVDDGSSVLILAFESHEAPHDERIAQALSICERFGGVAKEGVQSRDASSSKSDAASSWKSAFIEAPYLQSLLISMGVVVDTFETACTWQDFPHVHDEICGTLRRVMKELCGGGVLSCRFTHVYPDGPAPYYTFIAPGREGEELAIWTQLKKTASEVLLRTGATITHHHSVGRLHRPFYEQEVPPLFLEMLRAVKARVDPARVLNPGALFSQEKID